MIAHVVAAAGVRPGVLSSLRAKRSSFRGGLGGLSFGSGFLFLGEQIVYGWA